MNIKKIYKKATIVASATLLTFASTQSAIAAPGTLATAPLFLSTLVEPNVFFTLDDSGSMGWNLMVQDGTAGFTTSSGLPSINGSLRAWYNPEWYWQGNVLPPSDGTGSIWIMRNHNGNKNYYNPDITYTPWAGVKANGDPMYTQASVTAAVFHPENNTTTTTNLTTKKTHNGVANAIYLPSYYEWTDDHDAAGNPVAGGDGVIDAADTHTLVEINLTDLHDPSDPTSTYLEIENFANWFVYYRSRELAAKAAIGRVINNTDATRMGLDVFNDGHQEDLKTMTDAANKRKLLEEFYEINSNGGTPARNALKRVGDFFSDPSSGAIVGLADGGECQQNFNILMTDGFWNGGNPSDIDNADGDVNTTFDGNASQSNDGGNYADNFSDTLADVAMHYYENDLSPLTGRVPTNDGVDENSEQHLVTYTIAFGLNGNLDPSLDPTDPTFPGWPQPIANQNSTVDDLFHAAYNGRGQYLNAQNPDELEESLNTAISDIAERTATASAASINASTLTEDTTVYLAQFNSNRWQGHLFALNLNLDTGKLDASPLWDAATVLDSRNISTNPRVILTHDGNDGVPFQWNTTTDVLSTAQKNDLKTNSAGGTDADTIAMARVEYLRGSRDNEGTGENFRERASLLGDIINSGPVFVGPPRASWPDTSPFPTATGERYSDFKKGSAKDRTGIVYVGANDGMLHGFKEGPESQGGGSEMLAYIPGSIFSANSGEGLHYLTDQNYVHNYYNDLTPSVSDIFIDNAWKTVLINGLRSGGRGVYALDVTDPSLFKESNADKLVLWEFTDADDNDLGFTFSRPQIGLANDGSWVAIFGNGYNSTGSGEAKLFILNIKEGMDGNWTGGYEEISVPSSDPTDTNGLSTPTLADLDGNGTIDRAYAGDLQGNMWAFDLSGGASTDWKLDYKLFSTDGARPITRKPGISRHPTISGTGSNDPNIMVYFGSGQYLVDADNADNSTNHFYGVWDRGDSNRAIGNLVQQTVTQSTITDNNGDTIPVRSNSANVVNYAGGEYGWYFELPTSGERAVFIPVVRGSVVFFNTLIPVDDACSGGATGWRMVVDLIDGSSPDSPEFDVNNDGYVTAADATNSGPPSGGMLPDDVLPNDDAFYEDNRLTGDEEGRVSELPKLQTGRFSWQELIQ